MQDGGRSGRLSLEDGEWAGISGWQPALQPEEGLCLLPGIEAVQLGENSAGFVFHYYDNQKVENRQVDQFYKSSSEGYQLVLSLETYHDNAGACPPGCYSTITEYEWLPAESDGLYDLQVTIRGTQLVEGQVVVVNEKSGICLSGWVLSALGAGRRDNHRIISNIPLTMNCRLGKARRSDRPIVM